MIATTHIYVAISYDIMCTSLSLKGRSVQLRTSVVAYSSVHVLEKHLGYFNHIFRLSLSVASA